MAKKREEFDNVYKWNTKDLFKSETDFKKEIEKLNKDIRKIKKYQNRIMDNPNTLLELLNLDTSLGRRIERVYIYAHTNNDADTKNVKFQELFGIARNLYASYIELSSFIVPEILKADYDKILDFIKREPKLNDYKLNLKDIFRNKKHVLSEDAEAALSIVSKISSAPDEIIGVLTDSDFTFEPIMVNEKKTELNESNFSVFLKDKNRTVRESAFKSIYKTYENFKTTISAILKNEVDKNISYSKVRGYKSSLERSLFANEIPVSVYNNLIESVHKNLKPLYKYFELKKKNLGLKDIHIYDTYTDISDIQRKYSFDEAKELVLEVVKPLGNDYVKNITKSFTDRWIDSCNNDGKRGGAYCTACYDTHPYVLMSFEGTLSDVSTLAHELGHAMHYYYACNNQLYQNYNYSIFVAEVASQVNEILLSRYLLDHTSDSKEKLKLIDDLLQKYKSTIYRQTMFAEFEKFIHEYAENGGILTHEVMCNKYYDLNKLYFGDNVVCDDEIRYEWERIPHFYMNFYVYQYATGFAASVYLANKIYENDTKTRDKYLKFLSLGSTKNPIDSLKVAGVDMTKSEVMDEAICYMNELLKEYELLGSEIDG